MLRPAPFPFPSRVVFNMDATESQGPTVNAVAIVFAIITAVTITLRLWARVFIVKKVGADDGESTPNRPSSS